MSFSSPGWLLAGGLAVAVMLWTWRIADSRQRDSLRLFVGSRLRDALTRSMSTARRNTRRALFALAVALLAVALAGPRAGHRWQTVKRRGNDIIFAVDTSRSMTTPDVKPNRLARAKLAIDDFVARLNGDAVGLVAFAGSAFLQCPVTLDYGAFHESLAALDTHIIPRGGTNITSAIEAARSALQRRPDSDKVLILVTDGEDLEGNALAAARSAAQQDGLKIYTVGVGSANGDLIPLPADQGGGYLQDRAGNLVRSHLDETGLKAIAAATGGTYAPLGARNEGLEVIYQKALAPLAQHDLETRSQQVPIERYQWPLGAAIALLLLSLLIGTRRRVALDAARPGAMPSAAPSGPRPRGARQTPRRFASPALILCALAALGHLASAHASVTTAADAYAHGDFAAAQQQFTAAAAIAPQHPLLQYDAGTAAYRAGAYPQAAQAFQASVDAVKSSKPERLREQQDAYYDLGNTLYRQGEATQTSDRNATIDSWTRAVKSYDAALQLQADDADSRFNRDFVKRKLDALKQQQSQPQSQQQKQQPQPPPSAKNNAGSDSKGSQNSKGSQGSQNSQGSQGSQGSQHTKGSAGTPPGSAGSPGSKDAQGSPGGRSTDDAQNRPLQAGQQTGQSLGHSPGQRQGEGQDHGQTPTPAQSSPGEPATQPGSAPRSGDLARAGNAAQSGDDARTPGGMSRQEARELLDSVKSEEKEPPTAPLARNGGHDDTVDEPLKDW